MNYLPIPSTHPPGATEIEEETSDAPARGFPADAPAVLDRLKRSTRILLLACVVLAAVSIGAYLEYSNIYTEVFNTCYARYQRAFPRLRSMIADCALVCTFTLCQCSVSTFENDLKQLLCGLFWSKFHRAWCRTALNLT